MLFHRKLGLIQIFFSSTWATSIFHFKWVLPFPRKIYPFEIFTRATPGSSLVQQWFLKNCLKTKEFSQNSRTKLQEKHFLENSLLVAEKCSNPQMFPLKLLTLWYSPHLFQILMTPRTLTPTTSPTEAPASRSSRRNWSSTTYTNRRDGGSPQKKPWHR